MPLSCSSSRTGSRADRGEPVGRRRPRPARVDDEIGVDHFVAAVGRRTRALAHAAFVGAAVGTRPTAATPCRSSTPGSGEHEPAQHPFERRAPARERDELVVAGPRLESVSVSGRFVGESNLGRARGEQRVEHVGRAVAQQCCAAGEERVRVAHLRRAGRSQCSNASSADAGIGVSSRSRIVT